MSQQSQHTPSFFHVTGRSHIPQGKILLCLGPGFSSTSPASNIMIRITEVFGLFFTGSCGFDSLLVVVCYHLIFTGRSLTVTFGMSFSSDTMVLISLKVVLNKSSHNPKSSHILKKNLSLLHYYCLPFVLLSLYAVQHTNYF